MKYEKMGYVDPKTMKTTLASIQDALGTEEHGGALVGVARNAHKAEQAWAAQQKKNEEDEAAVPKQP